MEINREKYHRWAWLIDLFISRDPYLGGVSTNREKLYDTAYSFLGKDASPTDKAPDDLACAESVNAVYKTAFGHEVGGGLSTLEMYRVLQIKQGEFMEVDSPLYGDLIISPTTMTKVPVGHVGIVGKWQIMSNSSVTGKWEARYTLDTWRRRYGFVKYFRCLTPDSLPEAPPGVIEIVEQAVEIVPEVVKYPGLLSPFMTFLATLGAFLRSLNIK